MPDLLEMYAGVKPDELAVVDDRPGGPIISRTWAQLDAESNQLANVFLEHGAEPGAKVVWCGENSIGVVRAIGAARKAALTAVPLNYRLADDEAAYVVDHCDAVVACVDAASAPMFERIRDRIPKFGTILVYDGAPPAGMADADALLAVASTAAPDVPAPEGSGGATMIYTSGTTGKPKGAYRPEGSDPELVVAMVAHIGYQPDDVYLTTGPLYHSGPGGFMVIAQSLGGTVVIQRRFDAEDWLRLVHRYAVTTTFSAPTPIRKVCSLPEEVKARFDRSSMRRMVANAAPWSMALKQLYLSDFPADSLWEVYGSTELGVDCILEPKDQLRKPGSCGRPAPLVEVQLFDDDGHVVTGTGPDHPGELFVRGRAVFGDYYKQHDRYLADQREGWQTVGDVAYRDDEGYYYICDRKKDMVISGGMNVYPAEVEAALELHPDIFEAAVFGIPSEEWGELVHAAVVLRPGAELDAAAVQSFAREKLASYKIPRSVSFLDELPKTGSGKILKRELRAPYWSDRSSSVV